MMFQVVLVLWKSVSELKSRNSVGNLGIFLIRHLVTLSCLKIALVFFSRTNAGKYFFFFKKVYLENKGGRDGKKGNLTGVWTKNLDGWGAALWPLIPFYLNLPGCICFSFVWVCERFVPSVQSQQILDHDSHGFLDAWREREKNS